MNTITVMSIGIRVKKHPEVALADDGTIFWITVLASGAYWNQVPYIPQTEDIIV